MYKSSHHLLVIVNAVYDYHIKTSEFCAKFAITLVKICAVVVMIAVIIIVMMAFQASKGLGFLLAPNYRRLEKGKSYDS